MLRWRLRLLFDGISIIGRARKGAWISVICVVSAISNYSVNVSGLNRIFDMYAINAGSSGDLYVLGINMELSGPFERTVDSVGSHTFMSGPT